MRVRQLAMLWFTIVCVACANESEPDQTSSDAFHTFRTNEATWSYGAEGNPQIGFDAPCVYVQARASDGTYRALSCPTQRDEQREYAAHVELLDRTFVVGYGLREKEQLILPDAQHMHVSEVVDERRYFFAQLPGNPPTAAFGLEVLGDSGQTRVLGAQDRKSSEGT